MVQSVVEVFAVGDVVRRRALILTLGLKSERTGGVEQGAA